MALMNPTCEPQSANLQHASHQHDSYQYASHQHENFQPALPSLQSATRTARNQPAL